MNAASSPMEYAKNLYLNGELITDLVIPDTITSIRPGAFQNCATMTSVTIPQSVVSIGDSAFANCRSLWHVLYMGSEQAWKSIEIGSVENLPLYIATRHYNSNGKEIIDSANKLCTICPPPENKPSVGPSETVPPPSAGSTAPTQSGTATQPDSDSPSSPGTDTPTTPDSTAPTKPDGGSKNPSTAVWILVSAAVVLLGSGAAGWFIWKKKHR